MFNFLTLKRFIVTTSLSFFAKKPTITLIACYLIICIPINWILQLIVKTLWPDWLVIFVDIISYLLIALLIWVERYTLKENNFDLWSIFIFLVFGSILRPIISDNTVVMLIGKLSFIAIAVILMFYLIKDRICLSRHCRPFLWIFIGCIFCLFELFVINKARIPLNGISGPTPNPTLNYSFSFFYYLANVAISEEPIFRGFLMGTLRTYGYSIKKIIIIQGVVFSLAHLRFFQPITIISNLGILGLGLFFGILASKSKSILPSYLIHAFQNTIADLIR